MKLPQGDETLTFMDKPYSAYDAINSVLNNNIEDEPFFVMDVGDLFRKHEHWMAKLPSVKPFYSVRCNDSPLVIKTLAALGVNFSCATKGEMSAVGEAGVGGERIMVPNTTKLSSHVRLCARAGVDLLAFDSLAELHKIRTLHPQARLLLRLSVSPSPYGEGCCEEGALELLSQAQALGASVVGVGFHVEDRDPLGYAWGIAAARRVFDLASSHLALTLSLLDIGGGFPGDSLSQLDQYAEIINDTLAEEFGDLKGVEVIAQPGRYFVSSAFTLVTTVHSKREVEGKPPMYYINDGVYGSFGRVLMEEEVPGPVALCAGAEQGAPRPSCVWGPTCDTLDLVSPAALLPALDVGDVLLYPCMGAYTLSFAACPAPRVYHFVSPKYRKAVGALVRQEVCGGGVGGCKEPDLVVSRQAVAPSPA